MIKKRGQISIFIIFAIILLFMAIFYFSRGYESDNVNQVIQVPLDIQPVKLFIDQCLKQTVKNTEDRIGLQGGYYFVPVSSLKTIYSDVPYYFYKGDLLIPAIELIEMEFSDFLFENFDDCSQGFEMFKQQGFLIDEQQMNFRTKIDDNGIHVNLFLPITIQKGSSISRVSDFKYEDDLRFLQIYNIAKSISLEIKKDPKGIDITQLLALQKSYKIKIDFINPEPFKTLFVMRDFKSRTEENPYMYLFAVYFDDTTNEVKLNG